ncbi:MAG: DUF4340 domain-containing protein [Stenotrophobium sp.]
MNRTTLNLALVVVVAGLGAAVFFSQKKPVKLPPLTPFTAKTLDSVVLSHPGSPDIKLQKIHGAWQITAPVQTATDPFEMNAFTDLASEQVKTTFDPKQVDLKDLGLDPPAYSVTLNGQKIDFGGVEPINYGRYVLTGGKARVIADPPGTALDADYSDLVSRALLPDGAQITAITLPGQTITRSADDKSWTLTPAHPELKDADIQKFADAWSHAKSMWNAANPKANDSNSGKDESVEITLKGQAPIRFDVISRTPELIIARPDLGVRYTLSKQLVDALLQLPKPEPAPAAVTEKAATAPATQSAVPKK